MLVSSACRQPRPQADLRPRPARPGEPARRPPAAPLPGHAVLPQRALVVGRRVRHRPGHGEPAGRGGAGAGGAGRRLLAGARGRPLPRGRRRGAGRRRRGRGGHASTGGGSGRRTRPGCATPPRRPRCPRARDSSSPSTRGRAPRTTTRRPTSAASCRAPRCSRPPRTAASTSCSARRRAPVAPRRWASPAGTAASRRPPPSPSSTGCRWPSSRRHAQPLRPGRRPRDPAGHRRRRRLGSGGQGRRRRRQRDAVPQHREHRRVPGDGAPPRPAVGPDGQVAGAHRRRGPGPAAAVTPVALRVNGQELSVWIIFIGNCLYTPRGLSPAWRPRLEDGLLDVQYLRADLHVRPHPRGAGHAARRQRARAQLRALHRRRRCRSSPLSGLSRSPTTARWARRPTRVRLPQARPADRLLLPHRLSAALRVSRWASSTPLAAPEPFIATSRTDGTRPGESRPGWPRRRPPAEDAQRPDRRARPRGEAAREQEAERDEQQHVGRRLDRQFAHAPGEAADQRDQRIEHLPLRQRTDGQPYGEEEVWRPARGAQIAANGRRRRGRAHSPARPPRGQYPLLRRSLRIARTGE